MNEGVSRTAEDHHLGLHTTGEYSHVAYTSTAHNDRTYSSAHVYTPNTTTHAYTMATPASQAVADILRQPDDLLKLASYRKKLLKEKAALDAKLQEGVKTQLDATRDALLKLQASRAAVGMVKEEMMAVERLKGGMEEGDAFEKITRVGTDLASADGGADDRCRLYIVTSPRRPRWSTT